MGTLRNLRKRTFRAVVEGASYIPNFQYHGRPDLPKQIALKLELKTSRGKQTEITYPGGDADKFRVSKDGHVLIPRGDNAVSEQSGLGRFVKAMTTASFDWATTENDDGQEDVSNLEGLIIEFAPGGKGESTLPVAIHESMGSRTDTEQPRSRRDADEDEDEGADKEDEDDEKDEDDDEDSDDEDDPETLAESAITALLDDDKPLKIGTVAVAVYKHLNAAGTSVKLAKQAGSLAASSKFLNDKARPFRVKGTAIVAK